MKILKVYNLLLIILSTFMLSAVHSNAGAVDIEQPCMGSTAKLAKQDCYNTVLIEKFPTKPQEVDDVFTFCTLGSRVANVYITPKRGTIRETTTLCAHNCTPQMTTYNKNVEGDTSPPSTLPHDKFRPTPTEPDPLTCNPAGCFFAPGACCVPKFCPCTNAVVAALWMDTCSFREKGKNVN